MTTYVECFIAPASLIPPMDCKFCWSLYQELELLGAGSHRLEITHGCNYTEGYYLSIALDGSPIVEYNTAAVMGYDHRTHGRVIQMLARGMEAQAASRFINRSQWNAIQRGEMY